MEENILKQYRSIKKESQHIKQLMWQLSRQRANTNDKALDDTLSALQGRYSKLLKELAERQNIIEELIEGLDSTERDLIRYRYIDGLRWEAVALRIAYSPPQTFRIHKQILKKLGIRDEKR